MGKGIETEHSQRLATQGTPAEGRLLSPWDSLTKQRALDEFLSKATALEGVNEARKWETGSFSLL